MPRGSGAEGAGVRTIIEMVNLTRLDCAIASAGQSRIALSQALNHIRHRSVFQRRLVDQPSMRATVADLALELEAQVALVFRLCRASERAASDPAEAAYVRLLTPAVKFLVCKSTPQLVYEALECLGGNGYTEDLPLARYFRESPLNAIWEGSGNVMALDVLRAAGRHPEQAMATVGALAKTASAAFDVRPLAETLAARAALRRRRAPRAFPLRRPGQDRRPGRARRGEVRFRHALWRHASGGRAVRPVRHRRPRRRGDRR